MERVLYTRHSEHLDKDMDVLCYGDAGYPLVVFPTQNANCDEWEDFGMIAELSPLIDAGHIRLFCVDTVDSESWYAKSANKDERAARQESYYHYVCDEVVPLVHEVCGDDVRPLACGASLGATHAAIVALRRPDLFEGCIALSGVYRTSYYFGDWMSPTLYDNDITAFLSNMEPTHPYVDLYNERELVFCVGQGPWEQDGVKDLRVLSEEFDRLGVSAWCDFWGFDVSHDWPWWKKQMDYFLPIALDDIAKQEGNAAAPQPSQKEAAQQKRKANLERLAKAGDGRNDECATVKPEASRGGRRGSHSAKSEEESAPKSRKAAAVRAAVASSPKSRSKAAAGVARSRARRSR